MRGLRYGDERCALPSRPHGQAVMNGWASTAFFFNTGDDWRSWRGRRNVVISPPLPLAPPAHHLHEGQACVVVGCESGWTVACSMGWQWVTCAWPRMTLSGLLWTRSLRAYTCPHVHLPFLDVL